jgi:carbon starvation protein CstA
MGRIQQTMMLFTLRHLQFQSGKSQLGLRLKTQGTKIKMVVGDLDDIFGLEPEAKVDSVLETEVGSIQKIVGNLACALYLVVVGAFCIYISATWPSFKQNNNLLALIFIFTVCVLIATCRIQQ